MVSAAGSPPGVLVFSKRRSSTTMRPNTSDCVAILTQLLTEFSASYVYLGRRIPNKRMFVALATQLSLARSPVHILSKFSAFLSFSPFDAHLLVVQGGSDKGRGTTLRRLGIGRCPEDFRPPTRGEYLGSAGIYGVIGTLHVHRTRRNPMLKMRRVFVKCWHTSEARLAATLTYNLAGNPFLTLSCACTSARTLTYLFPQTRCLCGAPSRHSCFLGHTQ